MDRRRTRFWNVDRCGLLHPSLTALATVAQLRATHALETSVLRHYAYCPACALRYDTFVRLARTGQLRRVS